MLSTDAHCWRTKNRHRTNEVPAGTVHDEPMTDNALW